MKPKVTSTELAQLRVAFWASFAGSLALCAVIHFIAPQFANDQFLRMVLVILFFGCLASATWSLTQPFRDYNTARMRWQFGDANPSIQQNVERYLRRINRVVALVGNVATIGVSAIGLGVLTHWDMFQPLSDLRPILYWLGFGALAASPILALVSGGQLREASAMRRQIDDAMQDSDTKIRDARSESEERKAEAREPVEVVAPMQFHAGGYDWNVSDFYKNAAIFGQSGTGKTLCVLNPILDGLLGATGAAKTPASALILDPKGDFRDKIEQLATKHGRKRDLLIIDPSRPEKSMQWNPLDSTDDAQEIAGRFGAVMEIVNPSGQKDTFWIDSATGLVQNLIALLRFARPDTPPSLIEIYQAAMSDPLIEEWERMVEEAVYDENPEVGRTFDFFHDVWLPMPQDMRGTIRSFVSNMLGSFLSRPYDTLFAGRSTTTIADAIDQGKILYVNMPIADKEVMSRVVSTFVKLEYYREILRRPNKSRPSFFLCDEFQSFFTVGQGRGDADAFERTRQSNHANVVAFQNLNALYKQTDRKEPVLNMLGNCAIKVFLRNTEQETNQFASDLFGKQIETLSSTSVNVGQGFKRGTGGTSISSNDTYEARFKLDEFAALGVPSKEDGVPFAEAIAHLAARPQVEHRRMRWKVHPIGKS